MPQDLPDAYAAYEEDRRALGAPRRAFSPKLRIKAFATLTLVAVSFLEFGWLSAVGMSRPVAFPTLRRMWGKLNRSEGFIDMIKRVTFATSTIFVAAALIWIALNWM